jgi:transposase
MNERTGNWIRAHVHMFEFFGGVTPMLVADNL